MALRSPSGGLYSWAHAVDDMHKMHTMKNVKLARANIIKCLLVDSLEINNGIDFEFAFSTCLSSSLVYSNTIRGSFETGSIVLLMLFVLVNFVKASLLCSFDE